MSLSQGNWLRKHARMLLRRLLNITSYDLSVESKLLDMIQGLCDGDSLAGMFAKIRVACWDPHSGALAKFPACSDAERAERKRGSEAALKALFTTSPLPMLLGRPGCERAAQRLSALMQNDVLNRHLALTLTDEVVRTLFPELEVLEGGDHVTGGRNSGELAHSAEAAAEETRDLGATPSVGFKTADRASVPGASAACHTAQAGDEGVLQRERALEAALEAAMWQVEELTARLQDE